MPPAILPGYDEWVEAFWYLGRDRVDLGPIPAASIDRHAATLDDHERTLFRSVMIAMDRVYLRHVHPDQGADDPNSARDSFRVSMRAHAEGRK